MLPPSMTKPPVACANRGLCRRSRDFLSEASPQARKVLDGRATPTRTWRGVATIPQVGIDERVENFLSLGCRHLMLALIGAGSHNARHWIKRLPSEFVVALQHNVWIIKAKCPQHSRVLVELPFGHQDGGFDVFRLQCDRRRSKNEWIKSCTTPTVS